MTVGEMIMRLQAFDPTLKVSITDGWAGAVYEGAFSFHTIDIEDKQVVDIGIGGYQLEEER